MKTRENFFSDYSIFEENIKSEFIKKITSWLNNFQLDGLNLSEKRKLNLKDSIIYINDRKITSLDINELSRLYLEIKESIIKGAYDNKE